MKKEAKILTFHYVTNYGAVLQTLALYTVLKKRYKDVKILNYRSEFMQNAEKLINLYSFKSLIDSIYSLVSFKNRLKSFQKFRQEYLNETDLYIKNSEVKNLENTDLFIGSDQVWNLDITGNDKSYFGIFSNTTARNVFTYAASLGVSSLGKANEGKMKEYLENVDKISMREETGAKILENMTSKKIQVVLDPTLLLSKKEWKEILDLKENKDKYIFLYSLTANPITINVAKKISKKLNIPIIEISGIRKSLKRICNHKILYSASPKKFVELIANAEFVVTDSFHATSFSIIFEKEFITTMHKTRGSRITDLLTKLDIIERYTNEIDNYLLENKIDYDLVNRKLEDNKEESIDYINDCLNS